MSISALTFIPVSNLHRIERTEYESDIVSPRTLLKALRAVKGDRQRYSPEIEINGRRFRSRDIHDECFGCYDLKEAAWFLLKVGA